MHDESDFLRKLLENPADDTVRLVYADWLDEHDDQQNKTKAQFLRLTVQLTGPIQRIGWRNPRQNTLLQLAAKLPTDWLAVVSRLKVEGCTAKAEENHQNTSPSNLDIRTLFEFVCDQEWDDMTPTEDNSVRHCQRCKENVYYCDTIGIAREHAAQRHCIAVDLGIIRRENDLAPRRLLKGRFTADYWRREEERLSVDDVSREREKRKRKRNGKPAEASE